MVVNARPTVYISDDPNESHPLTPSMCLREQADVEMLDIDNFSAYMRRRHNLRHKLRQRFL